MKNKIKYFLSLVFLSLLTIGLPHFASANPRIEVFDVTQGARIPLSGEVTVRLKWTTNNEQVRLLAPIVLVKDPIFSKYQSAVSIRSGSKGRIKGSWLALRLSRPSEKFLLKGEAPERTLEIVSQFAEGESIVEENCKALLLSLKAPSKSIPFYVGASCKKTETGTALSLSFPKDVEFSNSSLFETKGKGESWRYYEIDEIKAATGVVGKFTFTYQGESYDFYLLSLKAKAGAKTEKEKPTRITLMAGAGISSLAISGSDLNASTMSPVLVVRAPHYPVWNDLGMNLHVYAALPLSKGENAVDYFQFGGFADYEFSWGRTFKIRPKVGYVISSQNNSSTGIGLSSSTLGIGSAFELKFQSRYYFILDATTCRIGAAGVTSHYAVSLEALRKNPGAIGLGLGIKMQSFTGEGALGIPRQFTSNLLYFLLVF